MSPRDMANVLKKPSDQPQKTQRIMKPPDMTDLAGVPVRHRTVPDFEVIADRLDQDFRFRLIPACNRPYRLHHATAVQPVSALAVQNPFTACKGGDQRTRPV